MKIKASMKYVQDLYNKVFRCGYCDLQYIFRYENPVYYNSGVYGWNCDLYCDTKRDIAITTGYRNMRGRTIPEELIAKYSEIAKNICQNTHDYAETRAKLDANREQFFEELSNF